LLSRLPELIGLWNELSRPGFKEDPRYAEHLKLLLDFLQTELAESIASFMGHLKDGSISYHNLRSLFRPDQLIVQRKDDEYQILKCSSFDFNRTGTHILARRVVYNGNEFGVTTDYINVPQYNGLKAITDLETYPLVFDPKAEDIRKDRLEGGRKYAMLQGILYREYKGPIFGARQRTVRANYSV
jgi:hypothetical protein